MNYENYNPKNEWEKKVLSYNLYDGDFGDQSDITFKDRIVKSRSQYSCFYCSGIIIHGELHRYEVAKVDGQMGTSRHCFRCCDAMVKSWDDNGDAITARFNLNRRTE